MQLFEYIDILKQPYDIFVSCSAQSQAHWHYYCEILYMLEGSIQVVCNEWKQVLDKGDLCYIYPRQLHEICPVDDNETVRYAVLKFDIQSLHVPQVYGARLRSYFTKGQQDEDACLYLDRKQLEPLRINETIGDILGEYEKKQMLYELQVQSALCTLLILLARIIEHKEMRKEKVTAGTDSLFFEILEYIDAHSSEPIKVQQLAERCHMSYSYFARLFRESYGLSCREYIAYTRVNKAQEFLLHTD